MQTSDKRLNKESHSSAITNFSGRLLHGSIHSRSPGTLWKLWWNAQVSIFIQEYLVEASYVAFLHEECHRNYIQDTWKYVFCKCVSKYRPVSIKQHIPLLCLSSYQSHNNKDEFTSTKPQKPSGLLHLHKTSCFLSLLSLESKSDCTHRSVRCGNTSHHRNKWSIEQLVT